jgi:hypothetical protein
MRRIEEKISKTKNGATIKCIVIESDQIKLNGIKSSKMTRH